MWWMVLRSGCAGQGLRQLCASRLGSSQVSLEGVVRHTGRDILLQQKEHDGDGGDEEARQKAENGVTRQGCQRGFACGAPHGCRGTCAPETTHSTIEVTRHYRHLNSKPMQNVKQDPNTVCNTLQRIVNQSMHMSH